MNYHLVVIFFTIIIIFWAMKGIFDHIPKKELKLLRIFFPSWRFFEGLTPIPKIFYRIKKNGESYSDWLPLLLQNNCQPDIHRNIRKLFHNLEENLNLTYQGQIEQLVNDISELPKNDSTLLIESLTSYKIVYAYIKEQVQLRHSSSYFQFKIGVLEFHSNISPQWSEALYSNDCELR